MPAISDTTMAAVEYALRGLSTRADVRAHNVANVNTPGYQAQRVDFETSLAGALASRRPQAAAPPAVTPDPALAGPNENTVDLENELVGMMKDNLMRDALVNAYNFKAQVMRSAMGR